MVENRVSSLDPHRVCFADRKVRGHGQIHFPVKPMANPAGSNFRSAHDPLNMV